MHDLPVIDVSGLRTADPADGRSAARAIDAACRRHGFFLVREHGVDAAVVHALDDVARRFFALDTPDKEEVAMAGSGAAWRGWFPPGGELTSGVPDGKEGFYFGRDLPADDPRVRAGTPLHGPNPVPSALPELVDVVHAYLDELTSLAHDLLSGVAMGLGLPHDHFRRHLTADPTILFRLFHYPAAGRVADAEWGVAEHTDYGLLTVLWQDASGGLEVHTPDGWVDAPPLPDTFVCNLGDMLERMTGGRYRSTPHRVRPPSDADVPVGRLSAPFFFDPGWDVRVEALSLPDEAGPPRRRRWDGSDPLAFDGTYGEYLTTKVARVFPDLFASAVQPPQSA